MAKSGSSLPGPAGLAEWLPLLGSICQVLATLGEARDDQAGDAEAGPGREPPRGERG
jgi:hypothetical protein